MDYESIIITLYAYMVRKKFQINFSKLRDSAMKTT